MKDLNTTHLWMSTFCVCMESTHFLNRRLLNGGQSLVLLVFPKSRSCNEDCIMHIYKKNTYKAKDS